ncbi:GA-binding protein subunit beta-1-like isoform X2 [Sitophilus oryzae]|uniref:GA-binding protein subunit beta-1-like isoform X2 n=1 Tax=Sitophilus oryzae TaxID=7048 RepID=A0A6J2Y524_SITOR|nr:GA-binding protein subunit beta-1-like isoform X2 [Sitophilus oryzae]
MVVFILGYDKNIPGQQCSPHQVDHSSLVSSSLTSINELGKQLLKAAADGDAREIKRLLTKGSPFTSDWLGTSPLHLAAQNNNVDVCDLLLKAGISKDARNKVDRTPLHLGAYEGHLHVVESLVKHGADINCRDMLNMTPLHWAVQNGHTPVVEFLLKNGSLIDIINKFSLTPKDIALQINNSDIIELLQSYESDPQTATDNLVMQLQAEDGDESAIDNDLTEINNEIDPVIINLDNNNEIANITSLDQKQNYSQSHVIINLDQEQEDEDNPESVNITQIQNDMEVSQEPPVATFKIIDSVLQSNDEIENDFSAVKLLQDHGITMLPNDSEETNLLNTVMESGHQVVLTDAGKEVLNSIKEEEQEKIAVKSQKIITVTPEQLIQMTNGNIFEKAHVFNKLKVAPAKQAPKRIVMKKNRPMPFGNVIKVKSNMSKSTSRSDLEYLMRQLIEARKTIEEYKIKLQKKEMEAERYKKQLKLFMEWN